MIPRELLLDAGAVGRLNWQPRYCPAPLECIASRRGDVLEVIFAPGYDPASRSLAGLTRYRYRLASLNEGILVGTLIPPEEVHAQ